MSERHKPPADESDYIKLQYLNRSLYFLFLNIIIIASCDCLSVDYVLANFLISLELQSLDRFLRYFALHVGERIF